MSSNRELGFKPGECDTCRWFTVGDAGKEGLLDVGRCGHVGGPLEAHTTRGAHPLAVMATTLCVSSGMVCEHYGTRRGRKS